MMTLNNSRKAAGRGVSRWLPLCVLVGLATIATAGGVTAGCGGSSSSTATPGCVSDADCSGRLVCDASGQCAERGPGSGGASGQAGQAGAAGAAGQSGSADNVAAQTTCKVVPQSGCPAGHTCLVSNPTGVTSCYSAGAVPLGGACASVNDCAPGLVCYGQCVPLCGQLSDCPSAPYGQCTPFTVGPDEKPLPGMGGCSLQCNPADPANKAGDAGFTACAANHTCFFPAKGSPGTTDCFLTGTGGLGATCDSVLDCAPGQTCLQASSGSEAGACTPLCLMKGGGCKPGASCESFATKQHVGTKAGLVEVGYCN